MSFFRLFPNNHGFVKGNSLGLATFSGDIVVLGKPVIKVLDECLAYTGTFFIDAVMAWVRYIPDALLLFPTATDRVHSQVNLEQL